MQSQKGCHPNKGEERWTDQSSLPLRGKLFNLLNNLSCLNVISLIALPSLATVNKQRSHTQMLRGDTKNKCMWKRKIEAGE
jgi:hypothetical protein